LSRLPVPQGTKDALQPAATNRVTISGRCVEAGLVPDEEFFMRLADPDKYRDKPDKSQAGLIIRTEDGREWFCIFKPGDDRLRDVGKGDYFVISGIPQPNALPRQLEDCEIIRVSR
jgi:hypothetical protein